MARSPREATPKDRPSCTPAAGGTCTSTTTHAADTRPFARATLRSGSRSATHSARRAASVTARHSLFRSQCSNDCWQLTPRGPSVHWPLTDRAGPQTSLFAIVDGDRPANHGLMEYRVVYRRRDDDGVALEAAGEARRQRRADRDRVGSQHVAARNVELTLRAHRHATHDIAIRTADMEMQPCFVDRHPSTLGAPRAQGNGAVERRQALAGRACNDDRAESDWESHGSRA